MELEKEAERPNAKPYSVGR